MTPCCFFALAWVLEGARFAADVHRSHLESGRAARGRGEIELAIESFEGALQAAMEPCEECLLALGSLYADDGRDEESLAAYAELLEIAPGESFEYLRLLTDAYDRSGRSESALQACETFLAHAVELAPRVRALNELGYWTLARHGGGELTLLEARALFERAVELSGGAANNARVNLAEILRRQGLEEISSEVLSGLVGEEDAAPWSDLRLLDVGPEISRRAYDIARELRRVPVERVDLVDGAGVEAGEDDPAGAAGAAAGSLQGEVRRPEKIYAPPAPYTDAAREARVQGVVILQGVITREGTVRPDSVRILKGLPHGLSESAAETFRTWTFEPATVDGEPTEVYYNFTMNFRLD